MVVGYPDNKFGWIMSRTKKLDDDIYKDILDTLHRLGLINQVSFYTLIYQTQSRIYETSTSKVEMAIEL